MSFSLNAFLALLAAAVVFAAAAELAGELTFFIL
jgi:hypothetical protein